MADGLKDVVSLPDPIGEVTRMWKKTKWSSNWKTKSATWSYRNNL